MSIPAIPTQYAGVNFRSRLEARWAAMFDLLGWKWEYEPIDLDWYIPDFIVKPQYSAQILVEVKPVATVYELNKVFVAGWTGKAVVVGAIPNFNYPHQEIDRNCVVVGIGTLNQNTANVPMCIDWDDGNWDFTIPWSNCIHEPDRQELQTKWREAGNKVQWKSVANKFGVVR